MVFLESHCRENVRQSKKQMRLPIPHLVKEADRYAISDRAAVLIDVEFESKDD